MEYAWDLDTIARLVAHKHYLEDTMDDVIEQKDIAVNWIREKLGAVGHFKIFLDNTIRYMTLDGEEKEFHWNEITREGKEFAQFLTPLKRYKWYTEEYRRTEDLLREKLQRSNEE